jgi:hypothetical protein
MRYHEFAWLLWIVILWFVAACWGRLAGGVLYVLRPRLGIGVFLGRHFFFGLLLDTCS